MAAPKSSPTSSQVASPELRTFQARPGMVETIWPSRITVSLLRDALSELDRLGAGPLWFADASATTSFETSCIPLAGTELLRLKKKGLKRIVLVTPLATLRMAAGAVGLTTGVEFRVVERRLDAMPLLVLPV